MRSLFLPFSSYRHGSQEYSMAAQDTIQYLTVPDYATNSALAAQQNMRIETLSRIRRTLVSERPRCMEDCVVWARYGAVHVTFLHYFLELSRFAVCTVTCWMMYCISYIGRAR
jgi:hypothetical protein